MCGGKIQKSVERLPKRLTRRIDLTGKKLKASWLAGWLLRQYASHWRIRQSPVRQLRCWCRQHMQCGLVSHSWDMATAAFISAAITTLLCISVIQT
ncbi:hypothetical protein NPIL_301811 [Nephila pilipes]|uniref:Uncharacterized protein n=1 Tax=Nephila pilipes TaxID=299642 RepID=A0A8X6PJ19_NEPPI|nr:hypothetical protein NPIL_301811 [Nephila pilipes]